MFLHKVLLATYFEYPHLGGLSTHVSLLAHKLGLSQKDVLSGLCSMERGSKAEWIQRGLRYFRRKITAEHWIMNHVRIFSRIMQADACDLIHCHDALATFSAIRARESSRTKFRIVSTIHGPFSRHSLEAGMSPHSKYVKTIERIEREAWSGADAIIAVDTTQGQIAEQQGADAKKIIVIPNAVDLSELDQAVALIPLQKRQGRPWILVPRRFEPKNGVEYAIRAMCDMSPKPLLLLAGAGSQEPVLRSLTKELGLSGHVVFLGPLEQSILFPLMAVVDIVTIPSVPVHGVVEATSIAALEAMGLGKAIVASGIGGLNEIIQDRVDGMLVPPAEPRRIAETWTKLVADNGLRCELGRHARNRVSQEFSVDSWFSRIVSIYNRVLGIDGNQRGR